MNGFCLPRDYPRVRQVDSFEALAAAPWAFGVNALCWARALPGDFDELVAWVIGQGFVGAEGAFVLDADRLRSAHTRGLKPGGQAAAAALLDDLARLTACGLEPELNCVRSYARDVESPVFPTDVYSFHVDSAPHATDTWLCTYYGAASEGLRNDQALARVEVPATRSALLRAFGGPDDEAFRGYLREHSYDLHYVPLPSAQPFGFGVGALWRIAAQWPGSPVPPCIHRAPADASRPRLLLIS